MDLVKIGTTEVYIVTIADYPGHNQREREQAAVMHIIHEVLGAETILTHDAYGAPIVPGCNISISHSRKYAVVAFDYDYAVGIDAEEWRETLHRVKCRFLSPDEAEVFNTPQQLLTAWTIKEAVYKLAGIKAVDFASSITIAPDMHTAYALDTCYVIATFSYNGTTITLANHSRKTTE